MAKRKGDTAIQSHYPPDLYTELKLVAKRKDWSDKKTVEKIVKLFLTEIKEDHLRVNNL